MTYSITSRKKVYRARKKLTAIDWNYHNDLPNATNEDAETIITRKYNQRTKSWDVRTVKVSKDYGYIWILMAKIFKLRVDDDDSIAREVPLEADDPRLIALTIKLQKVSLLHLMSSLQEGGVDFHNFHKQVAD